ncbi:pre-mRNA splicing factor SR-like 1 isoform X3 [Quercus lobata]|uniref:pre-mRNA splicing factor SR-like 1 isoform X3 n=1 Tax=Quercus lobata TaxID=97700 RepID=UPI0012463E8F|nr:pre-mRNA splicing factor SR-like 1 isoform X3 [Quercus lobata]
MEIQTCGKSIDSLLEKVLCMNILSSDYFKELYRLKTYHEVIDEIYNQVDHVEPWMTGNCRGPSTAFCLLYKFFTMKLTVKQMHGLLKHTDSPYIRCIGFLYLRYAADPKTLWNWFEPYVKDEEVLKDMMITLETADLETRNLIQISSSSFSSWETTIL